MAQTQIGEKVKGAKPSLKVYSMGADGKYIADSEIALWSQNAKLSGKLFYSGTDKKGNKYIAFPQ
jgi:hypothetical protein